MLQTTVAKLDYSNFQAEVGRVRPDRRGQCLRGAYGDDLGRCFGLNRAPALVTRALRKTTIAATELKCDTPLHGLTKSVPVEDAFFIALQLREYPVHELRLHGKAIKGGPFASGMTSIYDLKNDPVANLDHRSHAIFFYLPRAALDLIADGAGARRVDSLCFQTGVGIDDPVIRHLTSALLPAFAQPEQANTLFVDCVTLAVGTHVAHSYGDMRPATRPVRGGLSPWQVRRVKEVMNANLDGELSVADLAKERGLSLSYFIRAFRTSTGVPPHRWLMQRRTDKAKDLLRNSELTLNEIALACGFADPESLHRRVHENGRHEPWRLAPHAARLSGRRFADMSGQESCLRSWLSESLHI
jgi:AraC family transcriptional regulator